MVLEIEKAIKTLEKGGVIIYPSDTIWALGCDATNQNAINKIYKIKNRNKSIPFIWIEKIFTQINRNAVIKINLAFGLNLTLISSKKPIKNNPVPKTK